MIIKNKIALLLFVLPLFGCASEGESNTIDEQLQQDNRDQTISNNTPLVIEEHVGQNNSDKNVQQDEDDRAKIIQEPAKTDAELDKVIHDEWLSKALPNEVQKPDDSQNSEIAEAKNSRPERFDDWECAALNEAFPKEAVRLTEKDLQALETAFGNIDETNKLSEKELKALEKELYFLDYRIHNLKTNLNKLEQKINKPLMFDWSMEMLKSYKISIAACCAVGAVIALLYNKYGEHWKKAFRQFVRFCKNKDYRHKIVVDIF